MTVTSPVSGLEPANVWGFFEQLTKIPRPSKHEEKVLQYLKDFANERKLAWQQDGVGNMVIKRTGSGGGEMAPAVVIQGHVDMVTEKNSDIVHDFFNDPLRLQSDGAWLKAQGTTLGADNGIGVATALALLDLPSNAKLPPLECLFTVDEETGLTGAFDLDPTLLTGQVLLNLDTEDWGEIFIGCAGGGDSMISIPVTYEAAPSSGMLHYELKISGLMGGHSGLNINEDRGNAVRFAARIADTVLRAAPGAKLAGIAGGDKRNAIPREATATVLVPEGSGDAASAVTDQYADALKKEYGALETQLSVSLSESSSPAPGQVLSSDSASKLLTLLLTLPHGVIKYSHTVPGLVETSTNLASVKPCPAENGALPEKYMVQCTTRSSLGPPLEAVRDSISKLSGLVGASVEQDTAYPGWAPNPGSAVVGLAKEVLEEVTGHTVKVGAIHAGLECGIIGEKVPGIDMVSYGPTIRGAHSPDENLEIATVKPFWEATLKILGRLADVK
ncbi:aminoacyl-histidine dipeptidase [Coccomyxa subellipsoidea C-169]|uniref:Aminoacyl-histidine dipeptidase n=1 Tax=Coccomyxa subellipsoidea (strain C-169) TaxID=574566 RepID=I0YKG9_COCSC|nr:aminoacyl-histidine dipeptidase [Coccomyxa subellipsoidea C-169]EIE18888.1 aminoacyl-histidine dipeptidase [Coccomyxa subellipsoidea C-169]|eukprot:XP_005643432.1 aminoacyl-histidine dipeptidase [Coccomyxa subellipsoidea C-169]